MKVVVAYKWAANPKDASVSPEGLVDWSGARDAVSEYDPVAIEVGRRLVDSTGGEVVGVSVGGPDVGSAAARKAALSRGLDRGVFVADDALRHAGSARTAAVLAAAVRRVGDVDVVLTGESAVDTGARIVPVILAGHLGWPALVDVTSVQVESGRLRVERRFAGGTQVLDVQTPVVLAVATDAVAPRVPGMKDILTASKKPVTTLGLDELDDVPDVSAVTVTETRRPDIGTRASQIFDGADPEAAVARLVSGLREAGAL